MNFLFFLSYICSVKTIEKHTENKNENKDIFAVQGCLIRKVKRVFN